MSAGGWIASSLMHGVLVVLALVGLPHMFRDPPPRSDTVHVEIVTLADETAAPVARPEPVAEVPVPAEEKPPPDVPGMPEPLALPEPAPVPKPETVEVAVPEAPAPPTPAEARAPIPDVKPVLPASVSFANVEQSLLRDRSQKDPAPAPTPETSFDDVESSLDSLYSPPVSEQAGASLEAVVAHQIAERWNVQSGVAGARNLVVVIEVMLLTDARVHSARIVETHGGADDDVRRAASESARRAVLHFRDHPFRNLDLDRYEEWRHMIIRFDPGKMLRI